MAYDSAKIGYWAIDIGQFDVEYEWFLRNTDLRCDISYKTVSEIIQYDGVVTDEDDDIIKKYRSEIIKYVV